MNNNKLVVLAPCVLGPLGKNTQLDPIQINTPQLNRILHGAKKNKIANKAYCIEQLAIQKNTNNDTVAVNLAKQQGVYQSGYDYLLADLTSLMVAKDHIRLGTKQTDSKQNIRLLVSELNQWYKDKPWQFILSESGQIFIASATAFNCQSYPTNFVSGKNISHFIINSPNENWLAIINELQMILFQSPHLQNKAIKSIWLWGEQAIITDKILNVEQADIITFNDAENALIQQDSEKWLNALETLDHQLENKWKNYQHIQLLLDYEHIYHYKKSIINLVKYLTTIKKPTLHHWLQIDAQ